MAGTPHQGIVCLSAAKVVAVPEPPAPREFVVARLGPNPTRGLTHHELAPGRPPRRLRPRGGKARGVAGAAAAARIRVRAPRPESDTRPHAHRVRAGAARA